MTNVECKRFSRALCDAFGNFAGAVAVDLDTPQPWASGLFEGARCVLRVTLRGAGADCAAERFLRDMGEREWALPGHLVADLGLLDEAVRDGGEEVTLRLEALLIAD